MKIYSSFVNFFNDKLTDKFVISRSLIVVGASLIGNAFAYLFQLFSGRYFSVEEYSELVSLFSLTTIIPLGVLIFTNGIAKVVAEIKDDDYPRRLSKFFNSLMVVNVAISLITLILLTALRKQIENYLHIENQELVSLFIISLAIGIMASPFPKFLQGLLRFKAYSFITVIAYALRMAIILTVIFIKKGLAEVYIGLITISVIVFITNIALLKKNIIFRLNRFDFVDFRLLIKYSIGGAFAIVGVSFLQNIDILLVKHFFDATTAGIYGSTTMVGRIIFFSASPITIVMLPICAQNYKKGKNIIKPFLATLALTVFIAGSITASYALFPKLITKILFGEKYLAGARYLPLYGVFMLLFSVLNIAAQFLVAVSKFKESAVVMIAGILQIVGIYVFHDSLSHVIMVSIVSVFISSVLLAFPIYKLALNQGKED